jgi:tetratricopeptide (TPR) repeat protein
MSVVGARLLGSLQTVLKTVSQRQRQRQHGESWLTTAMAAQLARARQALAEGRAQEVVDDAGASLGPQVMLLAATAATIGSAYGQLDRGNDRDQAFKLAVKLYGMASAKPDPAEALAIAPALKARGKREQAIEILRAAADGYPDDVPVAWLLASELEQARDQGAALAYADVARRLGPGDAAERVACLEKAVTLDGSNPEFQAQLGEALLRAGDADQATTHLRDAIAAGLPPDHDARVWLAEAVRISETPAEALKIINRIVDSYPDKPAPRIARADIYADLGGPEDIPAALADLDHAIAADSRSATAYRARAQLLERLGRYPDAIAACNAILELAPDDGPALLTRGMARYALRELGEAVEDLSRAAELAGKAGDDRLRERALAWQGETLRMQRHYDEALDVLDQAVAAGPPSAFTLGTRGQVLTALGRHAEAIETLTAASQARPSPAWIHAALADVHRLDQHWDQALAELDMATIEGETAYTHFVRGLILSGLARTEEAADQLRMAWIMQRSPEIAEELTQVLGLLGARSALEESLAVMDETIAAQTATRTLLTRRAETLRTLGRLPEALSSIELLLADGEDSSLLGLKALVLADLGRGAEARDLADAALASDRGNIFARCARIEACMAANEYEDALAAADALLADVPGHRLGTLLKGVILCNIARYRETVQTLASVLDDDSGQPLAHGLTGYALRRQDAAQSRRASDHLRRAVALDPGERSYQVELADILFTLGSQAEACDISQQVLDSVPTGSQVTARKLGYAGWAALLLNRPDEAVTLLGEGVQLDSTDLPLRFTFALSLFHTGRDELAMDEYQAVIAACEQLESRAYRAAILAEALADLRRARERGRLDAVRACEEETEARLSAALHISGGD